MCPAGIILTRRGHHLHGTSGIPGCIYPANFRGLRPSLRKKCPAHVVLLRVHAAARGTCHMARGATWPTPSSFRRFGASNGVCPVRIGFADPELLTKVLGHTYKHHSANVNFNPLRSKSSFLRMDFVHSSSLRFWTSGRHYFILPWVQNRRKLEKWKISEIKIFKIQNFDPQKFWKIFGPQFCLFWHNSLRNDENKNFQKNQNFDPPNFWTPLNFWILKTLVTPHTCTKFGEISSKGVGARGRKAEKRDCALRAQFWPNGVITYMAHPPYQGASTLQVLGLCDRPFEKSVQLMLFC